MTERTTDAPLNISQDIRQMAENNIMQEKQAVEKCHGGRMACFSPWRRRLRRYRGVREESFAGQQVSAAFQFAQRLVRAKNLQEKALLQQQPFVQGQRQSPGA